MKQSLLLRVALSLILAFVTLPFSTIQTANAASANTVGPSNNSLEFADASSYLSMSPGVNFGTSAFTFETYFKTGSVIDNGFFLGVGSGNGVSINIHSANEIQIDAYGINATVFVLASAMQANTWYHLAVARDASSNETVWLDGVRAASAYNRWNTGITYGPVFVDTRNYGGNATSINRSTACGHCNGPGDRDFTGVRMTNFRVVVGSTVYDPNSATITPPATPLTNVSNTKLLLNVTDLASATTDASGIQTITNTSVTFRGAEKIAPTFTWSNVTKTVGDSSFTLVEPVPSVPGTFTYSSATAGVISLDNINTRIATVVVGGSSVITASFTPTDAVTYASGTTTMTVTVNKASQAALSLSLSATSKNSPYSQSLTLSTSGGTSTGDVTYAIASGGTASGCALANNTASNTISASSGGTCLVQATKASDSSYLSITSATRTFTFNAPVTLTYAAGDLGTGTVPTLSGSYFSGESVTVASGSSLSRSGFRFNGWKNSSNSLVSADSALVLTASDTLTAQWRQISLFGLSDSEVTELQSWNASTNNNSGTVSNSVSSFTVTVPGSALPNGTTVKLWEISNSNLARSKVGTDKEYIVNLVLSWLKSDGTVPTASTPITLSISNSTIKQGAIAYQIIGDSVTQIGTAASDGLLTLSITEDPIITISNPVVSSGSGGGGGGGGGGEAAPILPVEIVTPVEIATPVNQSGSNNVVKTMRHEVNFGSNAAWLNSKNIKALKAFILEASKNLIVEKIVIKGFSTPSKVQLNKLDVTRAKAVAKLLRKEGIKYSVVVVGQGSAPSKKGDAGRSAVVTVLGKPKKPIEQL